MTVMLYQISYVIKEGNVIDEQTFQTNYLISLDVLKNTKKLKKNLPLNCDATSVLLRMSTL